MRLTLRVDPWTGRVCNKIECRGVEGEPELDNLEVARFIARELGRELVYEMHDYPQAQSILFICVCVH